MNSKKAGEAKSPVPLDVFMDLMSKKHCVECKEIIGERPFWETRKGLMHLVCMLEGPPE